MARRYGWHLGVTPADINCPLIFIPFGFAAEVPFSVEGHACAGVYTETPQAGAKSESIVPRLPKESPKRGDRPRNRSFRGQHND